MRSSILARCLRVVGLLGDRFVNGYLLHPRRRKAVLLGMAVLVAYLAAVVVLERELAPAAVENVPAIGATVSHGADRADAGPLDREAYLMGRVWLEKLPANPRDPFRLYLFQENNTGAFVQVESVVKFSIELFSFQVRNNTIQFAFPHTRQKGATVYTIEDFQGRGDFNLKLTLDKDPRTGGQTASYFSMLDHSDQLPEWLRAAVQEATRRFEG